MDKVEQRIHPVHYVENFHRTYGHPIEETPTVPTPKVRLLRVRLTMEEAAEFCSASGFPVEVFVRKPNGDLIPLLQATPEDDHPDLINIVEAADASGDVNVVNNGGALVWGFPIAEIDAEINRSNMSKLGEDGKPITDEHGKTQKGPNYFKPDIAGVLKAAGWDGATGMPKEV